MWGLYTGHVDTKQDLLCEVRELDKRVSEIHYNKIGNITNDIDNISELIANHMDYKQTKVDTRIEDSHDYHLLYCSYMARYLQAITLLAQENQHMNFHVISDLRANSDFFQKEDILYCMNANQPCDTNYVSHVVIVHGKKVLNNHDYSQYIVTLFKMSDNKQSLELLNFSYNGNLIQLRNFLLLYLPVLIAYLIGYSRFSRNKIDV